MKKKSSLLICILVLSSLYFVLASISSDSLDNTEWRMRGKYLNHTGWDGVDFPKIQGLNFANYTTGNVVYSSPAVANGYVYVGSFDRFIYQLNATNVSQKIAEYDINGMAKSSPAVANGYVYIGSGDYKLYQLNASNISQEIANYTTGGTISYSSAAIANGYIYIGSNDNKTYQLNATNVSQKIAEYETGDSIASSPAVANGYVYVGSYDKNLYQLNATNISQKIANYTVGDLIGFTSTTVANGYVYVGSFDNKIYQLNATNVSQKIAEYETGGRIYSGAAVANDYVYIGSNDNKLYQLNATNISQMIASYTTVQTISSHPAVANGYVYVGSQDYTIYQFNATNISQMIANYTTGDGITFSSPAVANGYVYIGSSDYNLYQLNADNISLTTNDFVTPELNVSNITINEDSSIGSLFNASDTSGLSYWWVNDTTNFKINQSGYFENNIELTVRSYSVTISINDTYGNTASEIILVTVNAVADIIPTSSSETPNYYPTESNLQEGYTKQLYTNWRINFKSNGENHQLKLNYFDKINKTATITISSEPQTKTLLLDEEWKINLNNDSYYDLLVRLDNVTFKRANLFIQEINETIESEIIVENTTSQEKTTNETRTNTNKNNYSWLWTIIVLIGLSIVGYFYFKRNKQK